MDATKDIRIACQISTVAHEKSKLNKTSYQNNISSDIPETTATEGLNIQPR